MTAAASAVAPAVATAPARNDEWPERIVCFACGSLVHCETTRDGLVCVPCVPEAERICDAMDWSDLEPYLEAPPAEAAGAAVATEVAP